jgi:hypothetical protein
MENAEKKTAPERKPTPYWAIVRAELDAKSETSKTRRTGLIIHHGNAPTPPGLARNTRFVSPPAVLIPGSTKNLDGKINASREYGAVNNRGRVRIVKRLYSRSRKRGLFVEILNSW